MRPARPGSGRRSKEKVAPRHAKRPACPSLQVTTWEAQGRQPKATADAQGTRH